MTLTESIRIAIRSLLANKLRAILTMLGIIIGVGAVITLMSAGKGVEQLVEESFQSVGSNLLFIFPGRDYYKVKHHRGGCEIEIMNDCFARFADYYHCIIFHPDERTYYLIYSRRKG
jgi:putative ABC transport system permease protein